jgi:uncharacterized protein YlaI
MRLMMKMMHKMEHEVTQMNLLKCIPADVTVKRSENSESICDMCHKLDSVTQLTYTIAKYFEQSQLKQVKRSLWMCDECREKVIKALESAKEE